MSRADAYNRMLTAAARFQHNIALILEAKAIEAERSCQWICGHVSGEHFESHSDQLKGSIDIHDQLLEVIDGMTKLERALAKHMSVLLGEQESGESSDDGGGDVGDFFSFGGDDTK
ncbi:hypothetical protein SAMN02799630_02774 [Paenibacillus sp. UNCCL117]|uniref:hypothetical protein n=1 Tax=unclassified Paenibacillus TaxID=185978 RepID=UPI00087F9153|nr:MULTISPECIES: hypothetical protein [unclassified Paenibacillus]SDD29927.1 hypothetical protein SAMN04488602_107193 [Paenibacillus sp. cl123]SFW40440.1 hypothetical protein SAMN02799630_02774 [Paenibacillus sp. UNCCL117]